jgi:DNA-binding CsgD family transcriptional regulator/PAS domain-containing protein
VDDSLQLSVLIGDIYDAALDPARWSAVLCSVCRFVGGSAAMIFWHDSVFLTGNRFHSWGDDPVYTELYFSTYIELNPTAARQNDAPVGVATPISSIIAPLELRKTRFFKEWMRPQRLIDNVFANLYRSSTGAASFAVARGNDDGMVDAEAVHRMQLLVPHVQRAVLIGRVIEAHRNANAALHTLVDGFTAAIFLLDSAGAIIHRNEAAGRMLEEGDLVSKRPDSSLLVDQRLAQDIRKFVRDGSDDHQGRLSMSMTGRSGRDYLVQLLSLSHDQHRTMSDDVEAVAAVFIRRAEIDTRSGLARIAQRYRLTPREIDVLRGVVEIGGVPEVAAREGISARTVKAHLHSVFAKTGTDRQADLVKLLAGFSAVL